MEFSFASTSLKYELSRSYAKRFGSEYAKEAKHGVLFRTLLPRDGTIMTYDNTIKGIDAEGFGHEYEALVNGGVQPASITGIEIYDKDSSQRVPGLFAQRIESGGKMTILIEDRRGEFVVKRTYTLNQTGKFELTGEITTETLSSTPIAVPEEFVPPDISAPLTSLGKNTFANLAESLHIEYTPKFKPTHQYTQIVKPMYNIPVSINKIEPTHPTKIFTNLTEQPIHQENTSWHIPIVSQGSEETEIFHIPSQNSGGGKGYELITIPENTKSTKYHFEDEILNVQKLMYKGKKQPK